MPWRSISWTGLLLLTLVILRARPHHRRITASCRVGHLPLAVIAAEIVAAHSSHAACGVMRSLR